MAGAPGWRSARIAPLSHESRHASNSARRRSAWRAAGRVRSGRHRPGACPRQPGGSAVVSCSGRHPGPACRGPGSPTLSSALPPAKPALCREGSPAARDSRRLTPVPDLSRSMEFLAVVTSFSRFFPTSDAAHASRPQGPRTSAGPFTRCDEANLVPLGIRPQSNRVCGWLGDRL